MMAAAQMEGAVEADETRVPTVCDPTPENVVKSRRKRDGPEVRLYRIEDFVRSFARGRTRTWELINSGELEIVRDGRQVLITAESAERWLSRLLEAEGRRQ